MGTSPFGLRATLTLRDESAPVIGFSHLADQGVFRSSAQKSTSRAPAGSIESLAPHALQIPARRAEASLFHLFFNLLFTLNQTGGEAINGGILAHRRDEDTIIQGHTAQR